MYQRKYFNSTYITLFLFLVTGIIFSRPHSAYGKILVQDTVWEGQILIDDDILVPAGITLTIKENTTINIVPSDSSKIDPEYMSSLTEITVRGNLVVEGTRQAPVTFRLQSAENNSDASWAGIIIDGGTAQVTSCNIQNAETGIEVMDGSVILKDSTLNSNHYGVIVFNKSAQVSILDSAITHNDYGVFALGGAEIKQEGNSVTGNTKKDFYSPSVSGRNIPTPSYDLASDAVARQFNDEVLLGEVIWQGRILINGLIRVPAGARLIIMPGTIVEFTKKDTNNDGIGENGIMLQGVLIAKGTPKKPILFRSAEKQKKKGDWDAINIINSDGAQNLIEYCQVENAYRGLHFHYANVAVQASVFRHNYRGIQFQESEVALRNNSFHENTSAIQARDSKISFTGNTLANNTYGANFFRAQLTVSNNTFYNNLDFGLKIREGFPAISANIFEDNRFGLMLSDTKFGQIAGNLIIKNIESGLSLRKASSLEVNGNFIQANGFNGINIRDSMVVVKSNLISGNGERGVGVISLYGTITQNNIINNGLYAISVEDSHDISAPLNWYGDADTKEVIFDHADNPERGTVHYTPLKEDPNRFQWPVPTIPADVAWEGEVSVPATVEVPVGATLTIKPGAKILFAKGVGMEILGTIKALGTPNSRIKFTSDILQPGSWGEIRLDSAANSQFSNCDFEFGTWAIHSHFTALPVIGCSFQKNYGGIRFRSGPMLIKNSRFSDNAIGIRAFRGQAQITHNIITNNEKGIFVREGGSGLTVSQNNIFANGDYNIWVGEFNNEDVSAPENWWGVENPVETIFDANREPGIGFVNYKPVLTKAADITITDDSQQ